MTGANVVKFPKRRRHHPDDDLGPPPTIEALMNLRDTILRMLPDLEAQIAARKTKVSYLRPRTDPGADPAA
jgi:hypothetical protein